MAKKNLSALMQGIMGESEETAAPVEKIEKKEEKVAETPAPVSVVAPTPTSVEEVEEEVEFPVEDTEDDVQEDEDERRVRRRAVGRPPKGSKHEKSDEVRATFIVDPELLRKVKYIAFAEECLMKEVLDKALWSYIKSWEEANGKIRLPRRRK